MRVGRDHGDTRRVVRQPPKRYPKDAQAFQRLMIEKLPDFELSSSSALGRMFVDRGVTDFRTAARFVRSLPYGRTTSRSDVCQVLSEERGTCSSKHALIHHLAREHGRSVPLFLGIYEMKEANTPGVGPVLERYGLKSVPEAHCYLKIESAIVDLTGLQFGEAPIQSLLHEEEIAGDEIAVYKVGVHRRFIERWATHVRVQPDRVWEAREACIRMLEHRSASFG